MKLMTIPKWREEHFAEGSAPDEETIRRWLRQGTLAGRKVGGTWFVDQAAFLADGDELVRRVLEGGKLG